MNCSQLNFNGANRKKLFALISQRKLASLCAHLLALSRLNLEVLLDEWPGGGGVFTTTQDIAPKQKARPFASQIKKMKNSMKERLPLTGGNLREGRRRRRAIRLGHAEKKFP